MFQLLHFLIQIVQAVIVPLCFLSAWVIVLITVWSLWSAVRDTALRTQQMHQIPCANCQFFTSDYHLKCTVHPSTALTEAAIGCPDYEATKSLYSAERAH
ncbi:hypothetical protein ACN4EK_04620 [Pantanalinema rosaneae CENA516]|uniref:hypothetical protein n=1 Tax=Pantanalinema rosaneae TaxID=1620701 RepID=UPI003D6E2CEC